MPAPTLKNLSLESVHQLAHVLQFQWNESGAEYNQRIAATLSHDLKHKPRLLNLVAMNPQSPVEEARPCIVHKRLSSTIVREVFTLLSLEVGHNCNSLLAHDGWLKAHQYTSLRNLRELHSLWLPPSTYASAFEVSPNPKWQHQTSGCKGCVLTTIGSDVRIVFQLRSLLMSRRRTVRPKKGHPRLLEFVNGWVTGLVGEGQKAREIMSGSEMEGEELKIVRKRIWRQRREQRHRGQAVATPNEGKRHPSIAANQVAKDQAAAEEEEDALARDAYDSDFEDKIIDHYAALRSTMVQPSSAEHPAVTTPNRDPRRQQQQQQPSLHAQVVQPTTYPQVSSVYSTPTQQKQESRAHNSSSAAPYIPPRRGNAWQPRPDQAAGNHADVYRNLLLPTTHHLARPEQGSARWSDQRRRQQWRTQKASRDENLYVRPLDPHGRDGDRKNKEGRAGKSGTRAYHPHLTPGLGSERERERESASESEWEPAWGWECDLRGVDEGRRERDRRQTRWSQFC